MDFTIVIITYSMSLLLITLIFLIMPFISRKNLSFGITIPEDQFNSEEVRKIRKGYLIEGSIISILILMVMIVYSLGSSDEEIIYKMLAPALFAELGVFGIVFLNAYRKMKVLKENSEWKLITRDVVIVETSMQDGKHMFSPLWFVLYVVIIALNIFFVMYYYDVMPDQLPTNFGFDGVVTHYTQKSIGALLSMPLTEVFLGFIFIIMYYMIGRTKQQVDIAKPKVSAIQNKRFRYLWSGFIVFTGLMMILCFALMQVFMYGPKPSLLIAGIIPLVMTFGMIGAVIVMSVVIGQSGSRLSVKNNKDQEPSVFIRDDDRFWKLGSFYFNKNDPSLFVEKRFGVGWTINCARPIAWLIFVGIILLTLGFSLATVYLSK